MRKYYKIYTTLALLYTGAIFCDSIVMWDSNNSRFNPTTKALKPLFRNALANIDDIHKESHEIRQHLKKKHSWKPIKEPMSYSEDQSIGYLYSLHMKAVLGIKNKAIGYEPELGFGSKYKMTPMSIYHLENKKGSPVVFVTNSKEVANYFASPEYNAKRPTIERIPGLMNNNNKVQINVGPISSRSFKLIGVSAHFKNFKYDQKPYKLSNYEKKYQEFAIRSLVNNKFISTAGYNRSATFRSEKDCDLDATQCSFIWIPYKEMSKSFLQRLLSFF
ncbi:uncharacterized protein NEMAJ01_1976 [Nematocida major]|uniref:uncharacterized protein n=1 Tax=Nematocida major TaxID=1912982 RepID=UPI002007E0BB|nr:uncharacterized protein NEMAJ01_1976 [Nematocida major]KAH9387080.1 hypothetical protein NEMAJ01_1976 [Nematocida major]